MKINFLGDSITEGAAASSIEKTYVYLVGKMLNAEVRNYGVSGTRFARQYIPSLEPRFDLDFCMRAKEMNDDADYVFVFGGTNDYGHGDAPIGKLGDKTKDTFYGAIDELVNILLKKYKKEQIIFIPPLYRISEDNRFGEGNKKEAGPTLQEYRSYMMEVLNKYKIEVFDIKDKMGKPEGNDLYQDGLHPNDKGHQKLAELIANYFKNR